MQDNRTVVGLERRDENLPLSAPKPMFSLQFSWLRRQIVAQKFNSPLGYVFLLFCTLFFSYSVGTAGLTAGVVLMAVITGVPFIFACLFNLRFGVLFIVFLSFFVLYVKRFTESLPLGVLLDAVVYIMLLGLFIKQVYKHDWRFAQSPVTTSVMVWIAYNLIEFLNPWAASRMAWLFSFRGMAGLMVMYFIVLYAVQSVRYLRLLSGLLIALSVLAALYGLYQEFAGLPSWDSEWLAADELRQSLYHQWGTIRKFSFLSDPTVFGILLGYMSLFCIVLATGPYNFITKILLAISSGLMVWAMVYTGTRTAYVMLPAGFVFFSILTFRKSTLIVTAIFFMLGMAILIIPESNPELTKNWRPEGVTVDLSKGSVYIERIRSAFNVSENDSYQVRERNQAYIQPFIQAHPFGAGLGSVGMWGRKFSPDSELAQFPPDSGYVRIAIEQGWIGLLLYCWLLFTALRVGIHQYYRTVCPEIRNYYAAFLTLLYSMFLANFPQDALTQVPTSLIFYVAIAAVVKLKDLDKKQLYQ